MNALIESCSSFLKGHVSYAICGGFALEMFIGKTVRQHEDIDVSVFDCDRKSIVSLFMNAGWDIYFRPIRKVNHLEKIYNQDDSRLSDTNYIYAIQPNCDFFRVLPSIDDNGGFKYKMYGKQSSFNFLDIRFDRKEQGEFVCAKNTKRPMSKAILYNSDVPYLAPELVLFFKSLTQHEQYYREKSLLDFYVLTPHLSSESKYWLLEAIEKTGGREHVWAELLRGI